MRKYLLWRFVALIAILSTMNLMARAADPPVVTASASTIQPAQITSEVREFEVRVDDKLRGTHSLTIKSDNGQQEVNIQTDVRVDLIVYAYVFKFRGTEVWRNGRIDSTNIRCEDGSKKRSFSLKTEGETQQVSFNGKPIPVVTNGMMTTAYWRLPPADLREKPLAILDVDTGATRSATLNLVGDATVSCGGRTLDCQHFKIDGPSPAELWFDDQNRLVQQKSIEQGHAMELRLKQIRLTKDDR